MAMLETKVSGDIGRSCMSAALVGALVFAGLLVASSLQLATSTGKIVGKLGPLQLFEITKTSLQGGGYSGSLHIFTRGMTIYLLCTLLLAVSLIMYRQTRRG
ncbi:hypothetical protein EKI60_02995 [Candidatus Saccharibacteria bacterium]|nr:MAG: hypothetical protein EKI60_02995 [Candidatus Saccharibacteria bacterium]